MKNIRISDGDARSKALELISRSSSYGNLGLFIGAGFSKAVLNYIDAEVALSWGELLQKAAKILKVPYDETSYVGKSYPDIASDICKKHSEGNGGDYEASLLRLKTEIAKLTCWYPDRDRCEQFLPFFQDTNPSWIVTTNYDMVVESILVGQSLAILPSDPISSPKGVVPVFHLHGIRTEPSSIVIAQEDYVTLFRPGEYRQLKLPVTMKESTILFLGYGLGDVNVLTALDWSRNVFKNTDAPYPNSVIQVVYSDKPSKALSCSKDGTIIIETNDLLTLFAELREVRNADLEEEKKRLEGIEKIKNKFTSGDLDHINRFIDDKLFRDKVLKAVYAYPENLTKQFAVFLETCIREVVVRARENNNFKAYDQWLVTILDFLVFMDGKKFEPGLFQIAASNLAKVAYYVGNSKGQSWEANDTWEKRRAELSPKLIEELNSISKHADYQGIVGLLRR